MTMKLRRRREQGNSAVEYAVIAVLVAVAIIAVLVNVGTTLSDTFCNVTNAVAGATGVTGCSDNGGGTGSGDTGGSDTGNSDFGVCDENGDYTGDLVWMKVGYSDDSADWDSYPSDAQTAMESFATNPNGWNGTVLIRGAAEPDNDGLYRYDWSEYSAYVAPCGADPSTWTLDDGSGDTGSGDTGGSDSGSTTNPDCDLSGYSGLYWTKTYVYENGIAGENASNWGGDLSGNWSGDSTVVNGTVVAYSWADRGDLIRIEFNIEDADSGADPEYLAVAPSLPSDITYFVSDNRGTSEGGGTVCIVRH